MGTAILPSCFRECHWPSGQQNQPGVHVQPIPSTVFNADILFSIDKVNSRGSASMRRKGILHTSMSTIVSSTRRQVFPLTQFAAYYPSVISDCKVLWQVYNWDTCQFWVRVLLFKCSLPASVHHCVSLQWGYLNTYRIIYITSLPILLVNISRA